MVQASTGVLSMPTSPVPTPLMPVNRELGQKKETENTEFADSVLRTLHILSPQLSLQLHKEVNGTSIL